MCTHKKEVNPQIPSLTANLSPLPPPPPSNHHCLATVHHTDTDLLPFSMQVSHTHTLTHTLTWLFLKAFTWHVIWIPCKWCQKAFESTRLNFKKDLTHERDLLQALDNRISPNVIFINVKCLVWCHMDVLCVFESFICSSCYCGFRLS